MRSAVALAAFAAGALAVPYGHRHHKREIHTDYDIVVTTAVVYVTAGEAAPTAAAVSVTSAADTTTVAVPTSTHVLVSTHEKWGGHDSANQQKPSPAQPSVIVITSVLGQQAPSSTYVPPPAPTSTVVAQPEVESSPAPAPAPQTSTPAPSSGSTNQGGNTYQQTVILHHNVHRANHSSPNIEWSDNLATSAGMVAATCNYNHQMNFMGGGYGQNIAIGTKPDNISAVITDEFYNGEVAAFAPFYGQANPKDFDAWGHFSQVVWAASTQVGCATQYCPQGVANNPDPTRIPPYFTVCNYGPEGNMGGEYGANIGQSLGHPSVNSFYQG